VNQGAISERFLLVALTPSGLKLLGDAEKAVERIVHATAATVQDQEGLVSTLNTMRNTLLNLR